MSSLPASPFVLLSYRHESTAHAAQVAELARTLRAGGVELAFDQDHSLLGAPAEGWLQWMQLAVERAAAIVVVWSPGYRSAMDTSSAMPLPIGNGVRWETGHLSARFYGGRDRRRILSVVPPGCDFSTVPDLLRNNYPVHRWTEDRSLLLQRALHWQNTPEGSATAPATPSSAGPAPAPAPAPAASPAEQSAAIASLERFLLSAFSSSELHRLLRYLPAGPGLVNALPSHRHQSPLEYTGAVVQALQKHALLDQHLRAALVRERGRREGEIAKIWADLSKAGLARS